MTPISRASDQPALDQPAGTEPAAPPVRRRRGAELERALLTAGWAELAQKGYDALTYEGVAARAATSRAVIYRRWPTKPDLVRAVVAHGGRAETYEPIDTGSLRDDLVTYLAWVNRSRVRIGLIAMHRLAGYFAETGTTLGDLRDVFIGDREARTEAFYRRAVDRGEVDPRNLTPRTRSLAFDLMRGELLLTLRPVPAEVIEEIVDEVVLPLLTR